MLESFCSEEVGCYFELLTDNADTALFPFSEKQKSSSTSDIKSGQFTFTSMTTINPCFLGEKHNIATIAESTRSLQCLMDSIDFAYDLKGAFTNIQTPTR